MEAFGSETKKHFSLEDAVEFKKDFFNRRKWERQFFHTKNKIIALSCNVNYAKNGYTAAIRPKRTAKTTLAVCNTFSAPRFVEKLSDSSSPAIAPIPADFD